MNRIARVQPWYSTPVTAALLPVYAIVAVCGALIGWCL